MNLLKPKTIEERVVSLLQTGERRTTELLADLGREEPVTKQGFYTALRKLKADEVVVVYKKLVALNTVWLEQMRKMFDETSAVYAGGESAPDILGLVDKESVSYIFSTTRHLDAFWGHSQSILVRNTPMTEPVYTYDPHYWFYLGRKETEHKIVEDIVGSGRQFLMTVGGDTYLDRVIKKDFNSQLKQYHIQKLFDDPRYYVVVIGDYITEAYLNRDITDRIERVYAAATAENPSIEELEGLSAIKARTKIKISRNKARARALKTKLGKNFFIKAH